VPVPARTTLILAVIWNGKNGGPSGCSPKATLANVRMFVIATVQRAPCASHPGRQRIASVAFVGFATRTTCCSAANCPEQVWSPKPTASAQSSTPPDGLSTDTVPAPLIPTSSRSGVKIAATQSPSSSTVIVQGPVPLHPKEVQRTNCDGVWASGSAVAVSVTRVPRCTFTSHAVVLASVVAKSQETAAPPSGTASIRPRPAGQRRSVTSSAVAACGAPAPVGAARSATAASAAAASAAAQKAVSLPLPLHAMGPDARCGMTLLGTAAAP
jgi:hypothetical protein